MARNVKPRVILSVRGRSMLNRLNMKQAAPTSLGGSTPTRVDNTSGKMSTRAAPLRSGSRVPDAPGGSTRTNAAGKRAGGSDTTSTG